MQREYFFFSSNCTHLFIVKARQPFLLSNVVLLLRLLLVLFLFLLVHFSTDCVLTIESTYISDGLCGNSLPVALSVHFQRSWSSHSSPPLGCRINVIFDGRSSRNTLHKLTYNKHKGMCVWVGGLILCDCQKLKILFY